MNSDPIVMIGSAAANMHFPLRDHPADIDVICSKDSFVEWISDTSETHKVKWVRKTEGGAAAQIVTKIGYVIVDAEFINEDNPSSRLVYDRILKEDCGSMVLFGREVVYASLNVLYLLKMSHRYRKASADLLIEKFDKTRKDIISLREKGAFIESGDEELYRARMDATYNYNHPSLDATKDSFFKGDGVEYVYDHDSIHLAVAVGPEPAYTKYLKDDAEVDCDPYKFFTLNNKNQIAGVYEEACVLALERAVIPHDADPEWAFQIALRKVCTSITSGWFREFAWDHFDDVLEMHRCETHYAYKFYKALGEGVVKPFQGE